jgi:hypothetical protein
MTLQRESIENRNTLILTVLEVSFVPGLAMARQYDPRRRKLRDNELIGGNTARASFTAPSHVTSSSLEE